MVANAAWVGRTIVFRGAGFGGAQEYPPQPVLTRTHNRGRVRSIRG